MYSVLPLSLFTFKLAKLVHLYRVRVGANLRQTLAAAVAGLALTHTIGTAAVKGLLTKREPFFRTPKRGSPRDCCTRSAPAREETLMMLSLWAAVIGIRTVESTMGSSDLTVWEVALMIQSIPYAAALTVSLISAFRLPASLLGSKPLIEVLETEPEAGTWVRGRCEAGCSSTVNQLVAIRNIRVAAGNARVATGNHLVDCDEPSAPRWTSWQRAGPRAQRVSQGASRAAARSSGYDARAEVRHLDLACLLQPPPAWYLRQLGVG